MIKLYWRGERGTKKDLYSSFTTLEDFNRWSKKFLHIDFKNIISTDDSEMYQFRLQIEHPFVKYMRSNLREKYNLKEGE